ncbi:MAG: hypothetical protein AUG81_11925 [Verrucomicrobia bacterium 13_1_20CM_4_54_11]|nr:MAG: hypothetical protein AUG81_11925 [Verrucomicrobia bacterium 13_1_20CM_4_54_11]
MKRIALFLLVCVAFSALTSAAQRKIAYEHRDNIFVADTDGTHQKKVAAGALPEISPDGTRVAFNTDEDSKTRPGPERHIAIADLGTGKVRILKEIPSDNCFGPVWSPDGSKLAFSIMAEKEWHLGLVNADGSGFRFVKNAELLKKWELSKILTDASMNGGDRLTVSPDGKALLMDVDCGAEHERKNWDGPQPAIEKFDLASEKAVRITGKNDFVWDPFWLTGDEFLCILQKENENDPSIYRMSLDGKNAKLLVKHARTPSVSAL